MELFRKVVMVRFDTMILLNGMNEHRSLPANALSSIKYLYESGAKIILVGSWNENINYRSHSKARLTTESVAGATFNSTRSRIILVLAIPFL